jgi:hypothetical protein
MSLSAAFVLLTAAPGAHAKFFQAKASRTKPDQRKPRKTKKKILGFSWISFGQSGLFNGLQRRIEEKIARAALRSTGSSRALVLGRGRRRAPAVSARSWRRDIDVLWSDG